MEVDKCLFTLGFCEYKGVHYNQGQSWQDGCDLTCVCTDAESGLYRCTEVYVPSYNLLVVKPYTAE